MEIKTIFKIGDKVRVKNLAQYKPILGNLLDKHIERSGMISTIDNIKLNTI